MKLTLHLQRHRITLALVAFCLFGAERVSSAEVTLRIHHFLGEESTPHRALIAPWANRVQNDSGGVIAVEIYPDMGLGGRAPELIDQVRSGNVDIVWTAAAYTPGAFPRAEVFTLPQVHAGDPVVTNLAIRDTLDQGLAEDFAGVHPLLVHVHSGHALHLAERSVNRLKDLKRLVVRPPGRRVGRWTVEALGAEITKKRHPELPKALKDGKLDGALMSFQLADSMGVIEAVKAHALLEGEGYFGTSLYLFLMNKARYDSLPSGLQAAIDRNSGDALAREMGQVWREAANTGLESARERGNRIDFLSGEEGRRAQQALQEVSTRWAQEVGGEGIDGRSLIDQARQAIARNAESEIPNDRR